MGVITCNDCCLRWINVCYVCKCKSVIQKIVKPKKKQRKFFHMSKRVAALVSQGHKPECVCCGAKTKLTFDHIHPLSKGGADCNTNGQILCERCNLIKGAKLITIKKLKEIIL